LNKASETPGAPHTLIVTAAALRATDLARAVKKFQTKECMVAKLFAKHIKLKESVELCNNTKYVHDTVPAGFFYIERTGANY
jgi:protein CMS1